jgi:large repetitive protein
MRRRFTLVNLLITLSVVSSIAQDGGFTTFNIKVREAFNTWGNRNTPTWVVNGTCVARNGNGWMYFDQPVGARYANIQNDFSFSVDSWQEDSDCGNRCVWEDDCNAFGNDSDDGRAQWGVFLNLSANNNDNNTSGYPVMPPGQFYDVPRDFMQDGYGLRLTVSYSTPQPKKPSFKVNGNSYAGGNLCSSQEITLVPSIHVNPSFNYLIDYSWEYHVKGDSTTLSYENCLRWICGIPPEPPPPGGGNPQKAARARPIDNGPCFCEESETVYYNVPTWRAYGSSNGGVNNGDLSVVLSSLYGLSNLTSSKQVFFRVKATANGSTSIVSQVSNVIDISPSAPTSDLASTTSCSVVPTGKIILQNVATSFTTPMPKYLVKPGVVSDPGCDPNVPGSCLGIGNISGDVGNLSSYEIPTPVTGGTYTVFLFNGGGSQGFCPSVGKTVNVSSIPNLSVNSVQANSIACHGVNSGSVNYSISQGKFDNVSHTLTNTSTGEVWSQTSTLPGASISFSSLSPGNYQLTSNDNCSSAVTQGGLVISQPVKIVASNPEAGAATCVNPGNGTARIDVTKSSGTETSSNFVYQLYLGGGLYNESTTTNNSFNWSNLPVGNYTIMVREQGALDCNASNNPFIINAPPALSIPSVSTNKTLCYGSSDGSLSLTASGGTNAYYFEATPLSGGSTIQNTNGTFLGLPAGGYQIAIRNQLSGCSDSYSHPTPAVIDQPSSINVALNKQNISCFGLANGSIGASPSGGTPVSPGQYSYLWEVDNGGSWITVPIFTSTASNLQSGSYRVRITDANNCSQTSSSEQIIEPAALQLSNVTVNDIKCLGETGSINAAASGGTGSVNYEYSSNGGASFQPLKGATLLAAGSYLVRGIDQNGCQANAPGTYSITTPASALAFSHTLSNYNGFAISCFGGSNGSITISPSGGNGGTYNGYSYAIGSANYSDNPVIGNLSAGSYQVKVKDGRGCVVEKSVSLNQSSQQINTTLVEKKDVLCANDNTGVLEITAQGGLAPYQFVMNGSPTQASGRFTGLTPGNYTIQVIDGNNCSTNYLNSIASGSPVIQVENVLVSDIKCAGEKGSISITANGGTAPLTFEYALNGANSYTSFNSVTLLSAGSYTVRIRDSKGCLFAAPAVYSITEPASPLTFTTALSDYNGYSVACFGGSNGSMTIEPSGGNGANYISYMYSVDGASFTNSAVITDLAAKSYAVRVRDGRQCVAEKTITITQPSAPITTSLVDKKDVVCAGDNLGVIEVQAWGGVAPYLFTLDNSLPQSTGKFTALEAGNYTIVVKDKNQCESTITSIIASANAAPQVSTIINSVKCFGESNGSIDVSLTGGSPPFQYAWTGSNQTAPSLSNLRAGKYTLTITDNVGCADDFELEVKQPDRLRLSIDVLPTCYGQKTGQVTVKGTGGVAPYQYSVTGSSSYQDTPIFASLRAGDYTVRIKDANGCAGKDEIEIVEKNSKPEPNFLVATKRYASDTLVATDISVPRPDSIDWAFDPRIIVVDDDNWSPQLLLKEPGKFVMSMTGYYSGCDYVVTKTLNINPYDPDAVLPDEPQYKAIEEFDVYPNPSSTGNFEVKIKLANKQYILVTVLDALGTVKQTRYWEKVKEVKDIINMNNVVTGLYLVRVITETDVQETRVMINR